LIEEGLQLIGEKGARALTLREIGTRVGVSRMAAYRHFSDKEDLLGAICEAGFQQFADALAEAEQGTAGTFPERLHALGVAYVRFSMQHPAYFEVMFGWAGASARSAEAGKRAFGILVKAVADGQSSGHVRTADTVSLARIVWAQIHGISTLGLAKGPSEAALADEFLRFSSQVLLAGLAPQR
jgi:AcrR family transcriptional regulator